MFLQTKTQKFKLENMNICFITFDKIKLASVLIDRLEIISKLLQVKDNKTIR